ncbi:TPA: hypothetical protein DDW35_08420 [Candidatus Sumerlaeota bacterium]|jgi:hypothetical protein|nr:hypothetical protein [Candidatus Sumerlaeota bacterium]
MWERLLRIPLVVASQYAGKYRKYLTRSVHFATFGVLLLASGCQSGVLPQFVHHAEPIDLIFVAGQSNAVGFDARPKELPPSPVDKEVLFWWRCGDPIPDAHDSTSGGKWTHLQPQHLGNPMQPANWRTRQHGNFGSQNGGFGPEVTLARTLLDKSTTKRLAIIKTAWSDTGMRRDWNVSGPGGECYKTMVSEVRAAIAAAKLQGYELHPRAMIWVQGETDANPEDAPRYLDALNAMFKTFRKEMGTPELPIFIGVNTVYGSPVGQPASDLMRQIVSAQKALAQRDSLVVYVDTSGATVMNPAHFDANGTMDVGRRYAKALLEFERAHPKIALR